jgi:hypothetical protein
MKSSSSLASTGGRAEEALSDLSLVERLVYRALRLGLARQIAIRYTLFNIRRRAYLDELQIQARRVGCPNRRARLSLAAAQVLDRASQTDALNIVNTYNADLQRAIQSYGRRNPNARMRHYLSFLRAWTEARLSWKIRQIQAVAGNSARSLAFSEFYTNNSWIGGVAIMMPLTAVCPVCQGWLDRIVTYGPVPIAIAVANSPPYHTNCPHYWISYPNRAPTGQCSRLWMGR